MFTKKLNTILNKQKVRNKISSFELRSKTLKQFPQGMWWCNHKNKDKWN